jgi:ubiquinone/menaquinone biosynthesis C-methylase UbiE
MCDHRSVVSAAPKLEIASVQALDLSFRLRAEVALELLDLPPGSRVIDVGCGIGSFSALLAARSLDVVGADVSEKNVELVRRRYPQIEAVRADAQALPFEDGSFDGAVCMEVLEHVEDDREALGELRRVLRDGAPLVVSVPNLAAPLPLLERLPWRSIHEQEGPERHVRDGYFAAQLEQLLVGRGFEVESRTSVGGAPYRAAAGAVSLVHLLYRRLRAQQSWTWADVESDSDGLLMRTYRALFPIFHVIARIGAAQRGAKGATLLLRARASTFRDQSD